MSGTTIARSILLIALLASIGCQRRVQLASEEADSTAHGIDSSMVRMRAAQQRWEVAGEGEEAAALSARMLADQLAPLPPGMWKARAESLLDSLGIGSETATAPCALAVNFFSRGDPAAGAWPYLLWCGDDHPKVQAIEGRGMRLLALGSRGLEERPAKDSTPGLAVLFGRRGGGGQQPLLMAWKAAGPGRFTLDQTLGPDSLGGVGAGEFEAFADTAIDLVVRTYRTPRGFEECATCPHVYTVRRFRWRAAGFERTEEKPVPSPYSTFVRFIQAMVANDENQAALLVTNTGLIDEARRHEWQRPRGAWRIAPATDETPTHMVFFRGDDEAFRVDFTPRDEEWVISGFESVPRLID